MHHTLLGRFTAMGPPRFPATMLVDLPNWVGDQMMAMPALDRLVEGNRGGETVLHTRPRMVRFLDMAFPETKVVASERKASPISSARMVRKTVGRFDVGITLRNAARAKILLRLGARWCVGSRGEGGQILLSAHSAVDRSLHQIHDADPLIRTLGLDPVDPSWCPSLPESLSIEGERILRDAGVDAQYAIGLAPATARGETKRWPAQNFGELARRLIERGLQPVVVVGPGEEDVAAEVIKAAGSEIQELASGLDVAGLAALIKHFRLLVGNDSGPMQVATRLGTPVVAVFGPSEPVRTGPLGGRHQVISRSLDCSPCTGRCCPLSHHDCMRSISADEVETAVLNLVETVPRRDSRKMHR